MKYSKHICNPILRNKFNTYSKKFISEISNESYYTNITKTETLLDEITQSEKEVTLVIPNINS